MCRLDNLLNPGHPTSDGPGGRILPSSLIRDDIDWNALDELCGTLENSESDNANEMSSNPVDVIMPVPMTLDSIFEGILDEEDGHSTSSNNSSENFMSSEVVSLGPVDKFDIQPEMVLIDYPDSPSSGSYDIKLSDCADSFSPESPDIDVLNGSQLQLQKQETQQLEQQLNSDIVKTQHQLYNNEESCHSQSNPDSTKDDGGPVRICLVCGDTASGFHYGVSSCEACKAFFKRTIQGNIDYTCPMSNGCEINKRRRKACQACRFQKCLRMGMLKEGVRLDRVRGGRQKYRRLSHNVPTRPTISMSLDDNSVLNALLACEPDATVSCTSLHTNSRSTVDKLFNLYNEELVRIIKWAKLVPGFSDLSLNDQMHLLHGSWLEVLTLSIVFRSLPTTVAASIAKTSTKKLIFAPDLVVTEDEAIENGLQGFYNHCIGIVDRSEKIALRREEFVILKAILVCNADASLDEVVPVKKLTDNLLTSLHECVSVIRSGNPVLHVQKLLLLLPSIRQADEMVRKFWHKTNGQGKVKMSSLLLEMLSTQDKRQQSGHILDG